MQLPSILYSLIQHLFLSPKHVSFFKKSYDHKTGGQKKQGRKDKTSGTASKTGKGTAQPNRMPRESYQVPTTTTTGARGSTRDAHDSRSTMTYICGDCGGSVVLGKDSLVACPHCAGRVLYKERTKR